LAEIVISRWREKNSSNQPKNTSLSSRDKFAQSMLSVIVALSSRSSPTARRGWTTGGIPVARRTGGGGGLSGWERAGLDALEGGSGLSCWARAGLDVLVGGGGEVALFNVGALEGGGGKATAFLGFVALGGGAGGAPSATPVAHLACELDVLLSRSLVFTTESFALTAVRFRLSA
jgi:hypothetical protein